MEGERSEDENRIVHKLELFADNFQFQVQDQIEECEYPEDWNDKLLSYLYACGERVVGIGTVRDLDVEITIEIYHAPMDEKDMEKEPELSQYDHAVQCNIEIPSGKLMIAGCTMDYDDAVKIEIPPGQYGVRIFWTDLDSTDELGFEGEDKYLLKLYPETYFEEGVLKSWRHLGIQLNAENN